MNRLTQTHPRFILWLFLTIPLFAFAAPQHNPQDDWKEYAYAADGFAVSAPAPPALTKHKEHTSGGTIEVHTYAISWARTVA